MTEPNPPLPPALSKEEWEALRTQRRQEYLGDIGNVTLQSDGIWVQGGEYTHELLYPHATAALCLHSQEFGFTWEDVERLRVEAAALDRGAAWCPDGYGKGIADVLADSETREKAERLRSIADRIEALLPPQETV